ncbi:MAG: leucyl aminopeptidase family protein [Rhodospirillales bacterium]|nr:leucyl aminopeptidase family protein [Rhodospirillales bacterium]
MRINLIGEPEVTTIPIAILARAKFEDWSAGLSTAQRAWVRTNGFAAGSSQAFALPGADGSVASYVFLVDDGATLWDWAQLPGNLPSGSYRIIEDGLSAENLDKAALAWGLATYLFDRYRHAELVPPCLVFPKGCNRARVEATVVNTYRVRNLITTPANDLGPEELAAAAEELALEQGAAYTVIVGDDLLTHNYPAIHAVGRAHDRAPRLIDMRWGDSSARRLTLVGKGVCFDTGGLDLKPASGMELMKKDMGGAANVLGLAGMIMAAKLPVCLRVLIPAVENSVSANAMRPGDVLQTRKGLTIEIGNTDAEGRVILADALAEAASERPEVIIDFATLTGAARTALGTDIPALFCNNDTLAAEILAASEAVEDPLWRMPLWPGYQKLIRGKIADITNSPAGRFGGAITAALFLERFVDADIAWAHIDLMAWNPSASPGRPEGGEAMGMRAVFASLATRFG